ncbi:MAG TPA: monovalent cation/H(+) antiporter subunit G [Acidimicrobiales bacterium]|nr:monovalent cation/H(+) antiporter subunit G [Acidimicrobiales bacterium]
MSAVEIVASVFLVSGVTFALLAAIGLQQFDDVFARIHAATKAITLGLLLVVVGTSMLVENRGDIAKLVLAASLQFITAPVAAHMVGRAAYRAGTELSPDTVIDELAEALRRRDVGDDD